MHYDGQQSLLSIQFTGLRNFNKVDIFLFVEMEGKLESEEALSTDTAHDRAKLIEQYQVRV